MPRGSPSVTVSPEMRSSRSSTSLRLLLQLHCMRGCHWAFMSEVREAQVVAKTSSLSWVNLSALSQASLKACNRSPLVTQGLPA